MVDHMDHQPHEAVDEFSPCPRLAGQAAVQQAAVDVRERHGNVTSYKDHAHGIGRTTPLRGRTRPDAADESCPNHAAHLDRPPRRPTLTRTSSILGTNFGRSKVGVRRRPNRASNALTLLVVKTRIAQNRS